MNKEIIHYIGFYDTNDNIKENRDYSLAAKNKMDYICIALNKIGYKILIVSPSRTKNRNFYPGKRVKINANCELKLFPTFPWGNKLQKFFSLITGDIMLFLYLLTKTKRNENILVYHSLQLRNVVRLAKKIKGFKVILEVEEIYQDIVNCSNQVMKSEYKNIEDADKYLFPTELLHKKVNPTNKPFSVIYGTYNVEEDRKSRFEDAKIHLVYAGTFDTRKGGAISAISAAQYLTEKYHMHIIGFGTEKQIESIQEKIAEVSKDTKAKITYDGLLKEEEYILFLQKCNIGLSTQIPGDKYNETSFPSKILSYMANGLRVVSVRIKVVEMSDIGSYVYYYNEQNAELIAKTILSIDFSEKYDSRALIKELDEKFVNNIKELLEN
jgi:Glycosyl transferases group 1